MKPAWPAEPILLTSTLLMGVLRKTPAETTTNFGTNCNSYTLRVKEFELNAVAFKQERIEDDAPFQTI